MKAVISIIGTVLIILGVIGFSYRYILYTTNENIAQVGNVKITAQEQKALVISPVLSGIVLASGLVLVIVSVSRK